MIEMRVYHWAPAAFHANVGAWALMRNLLEGDEAVDEYVNVERTRDQRRMKETNRVREEQCKW
eukprot:6065290-Pyramimonas_sp.AAC.1